MNRLPAEIKHIIAECTPMESLRALCQVNREWNRIAAPLLYEHINIHMLEEGVPQKLFWLPDANRVLAHVKRLSIIAQWHPDTGIQPDYTYSHKQFTLDDENQNIPRLSPCRKGDWAAAIDLLRQLPPLRAVDLLISMGGPVELHQAILHYHPACRLSVYSSPPPAQVRNVKLGDWVLLPRLHTAHVTCFENPDRRKFREHPDRLLEAIVARAPHVKKLALQISAGGHVGPRPDYNETVVVEREPGTTPVRAKLELLSWPLNTEMPALQFLKWDRIVDYSCLKSWSVGCVEDSRLLRAITDLRPFQQLTGLTLALFPPQRDSLEFWSATEAMFDSLPLLKYLCLLGAYKPSFLTQAILRKHGQTLLELKLNEESDKWNQQALRRLSQRGPFGPKFTAEDIRSLAAQCPSLEKLRICVQRNRGFETDVYTALANFPCLTELDLLLNCLAQVGPNETPIPPRDLTEFEKDRTPRTYYDLPIWYVRDTMINYAIDQDLSEAVFTHIRVHQGGSRRLAKLTLRPHCEPQQNCHYRLDAFIFHAEIFKVLGSTWIVEMDVLTGLRAVKRVQDHGDKRDLFEGNMLIEIIFNSIWLNSIWPAQQDDRGWLWSWRSWPLLEVAVNKTPQ
ncbi:hypothetical protein UA08_04986 [Talaromyces atroroseus]|uniref:Uncharacterized protein n=1 Tax=Talaromyces atroroseus TaxID=1441469 RepID=A0A225AEU5_TALAT|nr:hypothetical protein UA08_04986 [Talaromyces atroroseus]OKL59811.1 hypothetical protein UA08_04986 [Talaromyces atroroseus]